MSQQRYPWWAYAILLYPRRIARNLERAHRTGLIDQPPNLWQLSLGVMRMWHRLLFRPETVGTCKDNPVRPSWRARALAYRPLRFPFLVAERAIAPTDHTGLASSPERIMRHLLGAHHDRDQFVFDLELLSLHPGKLEELHQRVQTVLSSDDSRSRWLRDLTVFENYHEHLAEAVAAAVARGVEVSEESADNPDISFAAYMHWCAAQPDSPAATLAAWRGGQFTLGPAPAEAA